MIWVPTVLTVFFGIVALFTGTFSYWVYSLPLWLLAVFVDAISKEGVLG